MSPFRRLRVLDPSVVSSRRILLSIVWLAAVVVYAAWMWWGLEAPTRSGWAVDAIRPSDLVAAWRQKFGGGWHMRYPPLHLYILSPVLFTASLVTGTAAQSPETARLFYLAGGLLSMAMALGTLAIAGAISHELRADGTAVPWTIALAAFSAPMAYYAKTTNLDVPYVFWFSIATYFWLRWARTRALRDSVAFAVSAALSVGTKDQALALFVLPAIWAAASVIAEGWRGNREKSGPGRLAGALLQRALWLPVGAAVAVGLLIFNPFTNLSGLQAHVQVILGDASQNYRIVESSGAGLRQLATISVSHIIHSVGWFGALLGMAGLAITAIRPAGEPRFRLPILAIASYALLFIAPIGYTYDRFWMPVLLLLAVYGGELIARLSERSEAHRRVAIVLGIVAVASGLARAVSVDLRMACDGRYVVQEWMAAEVPRSASIYAIGLAPYLPNLEAWPGKITAAPEPATVWSGVHDYIVTTEAYRLTRFAAGDPRREALRALAEGVAPYALVLDVESRPRWSAIDPENLASGSNLDKVSPRTRVYRRIEGTRASDPVIYPDPPHVFCRLR